MSRKSKFIFLILTLFLVLSGNNGVELINARSAFSIYTPKDEMIRQWIDLCDRHSDIAFYEIIGYTLEGREIYLFAIGNLNGQNVMYDGELHGWEDGGTECMIKFAEWLLESDDHKAQRFIENNCNLFIPVVNVDSYTRQNMRREYELENGTIIHVPYGVDLNRNAPYRWGRSGSGNPNDEYDYRGLHAGSEPEIQALISALDDYRPKIYLNTHLGASYILHHSETPFEMEIQQRIIDNCEELNTPAYSMRRGTGGGMITSEADEVYGASGWLIEIAAPEDMPNSLDAFLEQYYPSVFAVFAAFNEAIEPEIPYSSPTKTPNPTPSPSLSPSSTPVIDENIPILAIMLCLIVLIPIIRKTKKEQTSKS